MKVTNVYFRKVEKGNLKGYADIVFDDMFVVKGIRLLNGSNGPFIGFPSTKDSNGDWHENAHPLNADLRTEIKDAVFAKAGVKSMSGERVTSEEDSW